MLNSFFFQCNLNPVNRQRDFEFKVPAEPELIGSGLYSCVPNKVAMTLNGVPLFSAKNVDASAVANASAGAGVG